ncbi:MAG: lysophospholipid acyltransferase family protein, partial [Candidatus Krumholzibacteria bacterium]|nr:lysophospholipid acyltransferase family protein [Candidatus Krumholzibacteria bacterium]
MKIRPNAKVVSFLASLMIRLLGVTWRLEIRGGERLDRARKISERVIYAFWHGRLLALSWSHRNRNVHVLASEHYDGDLMGKTIEWLGFGHLKGSTTRGGARALRELKGVLAEGCDIGLTVDGPKGPRGRVQQGATELSRLASCAVVPITDTAKGRKIFGSWDRFQIPVPFAKVIVEYGEPLIVPGTAGAEER